jgi:hypothetical protein
MIDINDINKIPGFEETPVEINSIIDCEKIYKIAGLYCKLNDDFLFENAEQIKTLLDERRRLLKDIIDTIQVLLKIIAANKSISFSESTVWLMNLVALLKETVEKVTGLSWEELQE